MNNENDLPRPAALTPYFKSQAWMIVNQIALWISTYTIVVLYPRFLEVSRTILFNALICSFKGLKFATYDEYNYYMNVQAKHEYH